MWNSLFYIKSGASKPLVLQWRIYFVRLKKKKFYVCLCNFFLVEPLVQKFHPGSSFDRKWPLVGIFKMFCLSLLFQQFFSKREKTQKKISATTIKYDRYGTPNYNEIDFGLFAITYKIIVIQSWHFYKLFILQIKTCDVFCFMFDNFSDTYAILKCSSFWHFSLLITYTIFINCSVEIS